MRLLEGGLQSQIVAREGAAESDSGGGADGLLEGCLGADSGQGRLLGRMTFEVRLQYRGGRNHVCVM